MTTVINVLSDVGTCDHCGTAFDIGSRFDHCGDCGQCFTHCECEACDGCNAGQMDMELECMGCAVTFDAPNGTACPECGTARDVFALDETAVQS